MKTLVEHINEALKIGKDLSDWTTYAYQPKTRGELKDIIRSRVSKDGPNCDLNDIDTSLITDMSHMFAYSLFNGDISRWNVSNVKDMWAMFYMSWFNGDISKWDVSNVKSMVAMFSKSKFNQDISNWKINKKCNVIHMFSVCPIKDEFKPKGIV